MSYNESESLYFNYMGTNESIVDECYAIDLTEYGNCTYYNIGVVFNYTNFEIEDLLYTFVATGSFYTYDGDFIGLDNLYHSRLHSAEIFDLYDDVRGFYCVESHPDVYSYHMDYTENGSIGLMNDVYVHLERNESGLYTELYNYNNMTLILGMYDAECLLPMNYIAIYFCSGTTTSTNVHGLFYDFYAELNYNVITPILPENSTTPSFSFPFSGFTILITISSTAFLGIIFLIKKRQK